MPRRQPDPAEDPAYLLDMLNACEAVITFVRGKTYKDYEGDLLLRSGVERQVEIIGEAARNVSKATRASAPHIPWVGIITQRHRVTHEYGQLRHETIWKVATVHAPALAERLREIIPSPPDVSGLQ